LFSELKTKEQVRINILFGTVKEIVSRVTHWHPYYVYQYTRQLKVHRPMAMLTSEKDIKRVAVSWVVIARHGVERTYCRRIPIQNEEIRAVPTKL